jgi:hypothetical protein
MLLRLTHSAHAQKLLKGGVLLAAYESRRPTVDLDFAAIAMTNDQERILELVRDVATPACPPSAPMESSTT